MKKAQSLSMNTIIIAALALVVLVVLVVLVINAIGGVTEGQQCQNLGGSCELLVDNNPVATCNNWATDQGYTTGTPLAGDCPQSDLEPTQVCCQTLGDKPTQ